MRYQMLQSYSGRMINLIMRVKTAVLLFYAVNIVSSELSKQNINLFKVK